MNSTLSERYAAGGFLGGIDVFSAEEITLFRAAFDRLEAREGKEKCQIGLLDLHLHEEFVWQMATDPRVLDVLEALMGRDIVLLATHFFCKYPEPDAKPFVAWHQDVTYWNLEPPEAHTAWIALDDADVANGGTSCSVRSCGASMPSPSDARPSLSAPGAPVTGGLSGRDVVRETAGAAPEEIPAGQNAQHAPTVLGIRPVHSSARAMRAFR